MAIENEKAFVVYAFPMPYDDLTSLATGSTLGTWHSST